MTRPWRELDQLVNAVEARATHLSSTIHGPSHWRAVGATAAALATAPPDPQGSGEDLPDPRAADPELLLLFALLHDACRRDDGRDLEHGPRASVLLSALRAEELVLLSNERAAVLAEALADHTNGTLSADPTIAVCWDADRLLIGRVGIVPLPRFCSTAEARRRAHHRELPDLVGPASWTQVAALLRVA